MRSSTARKIKPVDVDYANTLLLPVSPAKQKGKAKQLQTNQALTNQQYITQMESRHVHYYETLGDFA